MELKFHELEFHVFIIIIIIIIIFNLSLIKHNSILR